MIEEPAELQHTIPAPAKDAQQPATTVTVSVAAPLLWLPILALLGFLLAILLNVAPLSRIPDPVIHLQTPFGAFLVGAGAWLPSNLGLATNVTASQASSDYVLFLSLIALGFACYGLLAWFIARRPALPADSATYKLVYRLVWIGAALGGLIYVFTPAMLSHDILVYASYSRLIANYHANPYFVPLSHFPNDPFTPLNYWASSIAAYGPLWLVVCGALGFLVGPQVVGYVLAFRLFALAAHLVNIWLVNKTLRAMQRPPRTVMLGTLLYAWNPLVLLESSLGGHNDVFMMTLLLSGVWLAVFAQQQNRLLSPGGYIPPIVAFTLAALVKFTTLPVVGLFVVFLAWTAWRSSQSAEAPLRLSNWKNWQPAVLIALTSTATAVVVALIFYSPFWIHHHLHDILNSFSNPPSALFAENSILRAILAWSHAHSLPANTLGSKLLTIFSARKVWDDLNIALLGIACLGGVVWLWRSPSLRTFALASLAALGVLLIVTPWFYSWYITWLVGLAVVALPLRESRAGMAWLAFAVAFSASALLTYLYKDGYPPFGIWSGWVCLTSIVPPIVAWFVCYITWRPPEVLANTIVEARST